MTHITLPRAVVEQALEAMEAAEFHAKRRIPDASIEVAVQPAITALRAALAQQAEPVCPDCRGLGYDSSGQLCACQQNPSFG